MQSISDTIRMMLIKRKLSISELANRLNQSQSNLSNKLKRDNFSTNELLDIANALDCTLQINFIDNTTNEIL